MQFCQVVASEFKLRYTASEEPRLAGYVEVGLWVKEKRDEALWVFGLRSGYGISRNNHGTVYCGSHRSDGCELVAHGYG